MLNVILFGPQGAGKGTQSAKLAAKYGLKHISTGELLREEIQNGSHLGMMAKEYMDVGLLVPDELLIGLIHCIVENHLHGNGYVFDGFPRTLVQAEDLDDTLDHEGLAIDIVVSLEVNQEELIQRLVLRAAELGRTDDTPEVIRKRQETYTTRTMPLLDYYKGQGKLFSLYGIGAIEDIHGKICHEMDKILKIKG